MTPSYEITLIWRIWSATNACSSARTNHQMPVCLNILNALVEAKNRHRLHYAQYLVFRWVRLYLYRAASLEILENIGLYIVMVTVLPVYAVIETHEST